MNKAINNSGNFTIHYPTKEFTKTPNYLITNKTLKPFETLVLQFILSLHPNTKLTQHLCSEAFYVSLRHIERVFKVFHDKGLVTSYKKKNDNNLYDTFYDFHTDILDGTREDLPDELVGIVPDTDVGTRENIKESLESNNDKCLSTVIENSSIPTQMSGHINTISSNTINNTKEKINNKKSKVSDDMNKKKQLIKKLNDFGIANTDNLFKFNSVDEIEQQIKWLPYRISINTSTEDQIKYKLIDSIRYKDGVPKELKDIELTDKLKLACRLVKTNGTSKGDMIQALIKKLIKMKELHSKKLDIHIKETIELETLQRNLLKQSPLTVKEKGDIQEKETELFEQHKQNISNELKVLRDSLDIKELFKSSLDTLNSQEGLKKILLDKEISLYGSLDSLFNRLETFILKETYKECA